MNRTDIKNLIDYNYWAHNLTLDAVAPLTPAAFTQHIGGSFPSVRDTLVHIFSAETIWLRRWWGETPTAGLAAADYPDFATLRHAWDAHEWRLRAYLADKNEDAIQTVYRYKTLAGVAMASPIWQMVQHLVNHGAYHRGQVVNMLRQLNAAPPKNTDLIYFYRERGK